MVTVIRPSRARCVKATIPRHERSVLPVQVGRMLVASTSFVGLLPPPALGERGHSGLACRLRAVRRGCGPRGGHRPASTAMAGLSAPPGPTLCLERSRRSPALWRGGEVQFDRLAASARARLDGELSGSGLEDQRRGLLGAVDADPGAEHPTARAVATRLVGCQSEALAHHASTLASGAAAAAFMIRPTTMPSASVIIAPPHGHCSVRQNVSPVRKTSIA